MTCSNTFTYLLVGALIESFVMLASVSWASLTSFSSSTRRRLMSLLVMLMLVVPRAEPEETADEDGPADRESEGTMDELGLKDGCGEG